ncbi:hypothetical protein SBC1_55200 (plasmid) [Caballeronia sp. SBC1]|uniref:hypothetical protein n=1 Tax=unclassified Caballeronia TaxID=2646786 RepID=UPI0013E10E7B|nr:MULTISPECIES: hypothetical protein [unclassified Caballeronia]QIE27415.1 hypothetical protein SBC2_54890 [Caballeronia sp. SBC2]QIN65475.1 hypothetical protein SBC1_55200 [Caballeronia sp. SBC1]
MPDSAVNPALQVADNAGSRRTDAASAPALAPASISKSTSARRPAESDADAKLARAARSAQRLALLSRAPYGAPTLDLFAEDAERATLQALNTDIRQSSLPGFELPEVFMAAVPGDDGSSGSLRAWRTGALSAEGSAASSVAVSRDDAAAAQTDSQTADAATLDLMFDDVVPAHDMVARPVQPGPLDDGTQGATVAVASGEGSGQGSGKRASAARGRGAARNVSITEPSPATAMSEVATADGKGGRTNADARVLTGSPDTPSMLGKPGASDASNASNALSEPNATTSALSALNSSNVSSTSGTSPSPRVPTRAATTPHREQPQSLAAALIADDRRARTSTSQAPSREASELDTARATAYADTIDALYAVIADQRGAAAALSRRVKAILMIVICVLLVTVATGVAQSIALLRLTRENTGQQQRIEQLMLNQQATLASFFDTDSSIVEVPNRGNANASAANRNPDSGPHSRAAKRAQSKSH